MLVLIFAKKARPLLIRLLPINLLRRIKKNIVNSSIDKLEEESALIPFSRSMNPDGINLVGYVQGETGLGQSCRLVAKSLESANVNFGILNYNQISAIRYNDKSLNYKITDSIKYNINLIHIAPHEISLAYFSLGRNLWDSRYNIVFWLWELEIFPQEWEATLVLANEVWTPSEFASESIRKITDKPVCTIPYALGELTNGIYGREHFGLPNDKFLFLVMYDSSSVMERKNPIGAIKAFKQAFSAIDSTVGLVIKINNHQISDILKIKTELRDYSNIYILPQIMDKQEVHDLIACVDVYVSLHRAEGFGLVPAEAMLLGTPVIATAWSSVTEFMNDDVACMVNYTFINIEKDCGPFKRGNRWADPDISQAAQYMQKLYGDENFCKSLAEKAKIHILQHFSSTKIASLIQDRLSQIYGGHV